MRASSANRPNYFRLLRRNYMQPFLVCAAMSHDIARRKELIRASAARLAANGFDKLNREMDAGNINGALLVPVTGMATDKVIALSTADLSLSSYQQNLHLHLQPVDVAGNFNTMLHELEAKILRLRNLKSASANENPDASPPALTHEVKDKSTDPSESVGESLGATLNHPQA
jgi:hypothetical protein